jgi:crossover junction endodeoxyribonuclease RuvC
MRWLLPCALRAPSTSPRRTVLVLGLDPGSVATGFGLLAAEGSRLRAVAHGVLTPPRDASLAVRLAALATGLEALLATHQPTVAVLEKSFHGPNTRSLIVLAQARGALLACLGRQPVELIEYSPAEVKTAVTGNGRADKTQVARMVHLLLPGLPPGGRHDATDALALALCYAHRARGDRLRAAVR